MLNKVLVTGITGFQGKAVYEALNSKGYSIRGLSLPDENVETFEADGVEMVSGSFAELDGLIKAFDGVDKAYISFPLIFDRSQLMAYASNVVAAWRQSSVDHLVFNTNLPLQDQETGLAAFDIKREIEAYFDAQKLPYISLRPTVYLDNLSAPFLLPVIKANGIIPYPVPAGKKIAWLSHHDLGKFVEAAMARKDLIGEKFNVGGVQLMSGEEIAMSISSFAKKSIQFVSMSPDDFEKQLSGGFGAETAKEIANIYRFVMDHVGHLQVNDLRTDTLIKLPVSLQTVEEWASQVDWG